MNEPTIFSFEEQEIRTVVEGGAVYWVAKDVAIALGYTNPSKAISDHCKGVTKRYPLQTTGGVQEFRIIGEPDLYRLIASSKLPEAERFERWMFEEILPTIRRTGGYIAAQPNETPEQIMAKAILIAQDTIARQQAQIEEYRPKALFADAVSASHTSILVGELAKLLRQDGVEIGQNRLFAELREEGFLIRRQGTDYNMPTQRSMEMGLFEIKERAVSDPNGVVRVTKTPKVTGKGQVYFVNRYLGKLNEEAIA